MATIKKYQPGEFCWADLGTTDVAGAKKFYRGVFGWKAKDMPLGTGDAKYSLLRAEDKDVCALYPMSPEEKKMKEPPAWLPYISVVNLERTLKKVKAAGGALCLGPIEVTDRGRLAILQDPTGASIALWQPRKHPGTQVKETPGAVCWHDLSTPDKATSGKFYTKVFGWKLETMNFNGNPYSLFKIADEGIGGMWPKPLEKLPPSWLTYWVVKNCAKSVAKAKKLGGKVLLDKMIVPEMCAFAILRDPQGAAFGVLEPLVDG